MERMTIAEIHVAQIVIVMIGVAASIIAYPLALERAFATLERWDAEQQAVEDAAYCARVDAYHADLAAGVHLRGETPRGHRHFDKSKNCEGFSHE